MASGKWWTEEENNVLRKHYATGVWAELFAVLPNRSQSGIRFQAFKLGLKKNRDCYENGFSFTGKVLEHFTEVEKAYLAGIIDGEGCIMLARHKHENRNTTTYHVLVSITNTSPRLMEWLQSKMPGASYCTRRKANPKWRDRYDWIVSGNRIAAAFLREIAPYLIVKREQAELLSNGYVLLSEEEREALYLKLRELKKTQ